ncbi:MAG: hypothetical protein MJ181_07910 [Treponema sp.]|nr:hypothetical protein [Treponema sp.]
MRVKKVLATLLFFTVSILCFAEAVNDRQMIKGDHWIYDAMNALCAESGVIPVSGIIPQSVGEIKLSFRKIDEEKLSDNGKALFKKSMDFLNTKNNLFEKGAFAAYGNLKVTPEFYARTNKDLPWSFQYNLKDNFLSFPVGVGLTEYFVMEMEPFVSRSYGYVHNINADYFSMNLEYDPSKMEFEQPRWAYGSLGYSTDAWGMNLVFGKEGLQIGNSLMGSVVYNKEFLTDFYGQLNIFTEDFKFSMDVIEVELNRYLYFHQFEISLFDKFRFTALEGSFVNAPFEMRFLNPIMLHHSHGGWYEYETEEEKAWYGNESHFCAYMCFLMEYVPVQNLRLYMNYAQTEFQTFWETPDVPAGLALQFGGDYRVPGPFDGYWKLGLEGVYTSPWMYVKNGKEWTLISCRKAPNKSGPVESWIGFKYGPDCLGGQLSLGYEVPGKWNAGFDYSLVAHGSEGFRGFTRHKYLDEEGNEKEGEYNYYPPVKIDNELGEDPDEIRKKNKKLLPSGIIQYMNQAALKGEYRFNDHFSLAGNLIYTFVFNNNNEKGNFQQGVEMGISGTYRLFR